MSGIGFSTRNKVCIRNFYNKPIVKHLKEKYGYDMVYFGLPSPQADDIESWLEYISYVVAFQCRDHKQLSSPDQSTKEVDKLIERLNTWEERSDIDGYVVYDGYMEEVIFRGFDNSAGGSIPFKYDKCVTLFNLDFCNKITSPQEYIDINGDVTSKYKFELIDKILELQSSVSECGQKFILFLTINSGYEGNELSSYIAARNDDLRVYNTLPRSEKKQFMLKHFVEETLWGQIKSKGFISQFLPTIFYDGIGGAKMMQFAVMCVRPKEEHKEAGTFHDKQTFPQVHKLRPIIPQPDTNDFVNHSIDIETFSDSQLNVINTFCNSATFKHYWK